VTNTIEVLRNFGSRTDKCIAIHTRGYGNTGTVFPRNQEHIARRSVAVEECMLELAPRSPTDYSLIDYVNPHHEYDES
jgi:hypothetical protein